jgi:protein-tyrosine-phosphatase
VKVAFLCTGNSARSQMTEGLLRGLSGGTIEFFSAGTHPSRVHPDAVGAMREIGLDTWAQRSKGISELPGGLDVVISVCDAATAERPAFAGSVRQVHWSAPDPVERAAPSEDHLAPFRAARDELHARIVEFLPDLPDAVRDK